MKKHLFIAVLLFALFSGCDNGEQKGKFAVGSPKFHSFSEPEGFVLEFRGYPLNPRHEIIGNEEGLLYVVFIGKNDFSDGYDQSTIKNETYSTSFALQSGSSEFSVSWNRENDKVKVEEQDFNRAVGNVILISHDNQNERDTIKQLGGLVVGSMNQLLNSTAISEVPQSW
jgi:hypothetical protein